MKSKRNRKSLVTLLLAFAMVFTQIPATAFAGTNDDIINWTVLQGLNGGNSSILPDTINDSIVSGDTLVTAGIIDDKGITIEGGKGDRDAILSMYGADGSLIWQTLSGGPKADYFTGVTEAPYGNFIAVGASKSSKGDFQVKDPKNYDGIIAVYDREGHLLKQASFGGSEKEEFNAITHTFDGGYVAAGYSQSVDGDMEKYAVPGCKRTAILVKYDSELNVEWVKAIGEKTDLSSTKIVNEFESIVLDLDGNFMAVGTTSTVAGDKPDINNGKKNGLFAKVTNDGETEWVKTYGGTMDDEIADIEGAHKFVNATSTEGYIISGTTKSNDGDFKDENKDGLETAFIMKLDGKGNIEWKNTLKNSVSATGKGLHTMNDGFLLTGQFEAADGDFANVKGYGKEDIYVAHFSRDGYFREMHSIGSSDKDLVKGITPGTNDNYMIFGTTRSKDGIFNNVKGPADGFLINLDKEAVEKYATEKYLVPVKAMHFTEDKPSMMAPLLYKDAYVEKTGELYTITLYFTNAELMGSQINSSSLGALSYDYDGEWRPALSDEYDPSKQIKISKITSFNLSEMSKVRIKDTMGDIRIVFNPDEKVKTDVPPHFPDIAVSQPDFKVDNKFATGGSDYDYTNDMAVLSNGNIAIAGQTFSSDMDFKFHKGAASNGYVSIYTPEGKLVNTVMIGGDRPSTVSYIQNIIPCEDGSYIVGGSFHDNEDPALGGDFAQLATDATKTFGKTDTFFAKYDKDNNQLWLKSFTGSDHDQLKTMLADKDGYIALIETFSNDGDMDKQHYGLADLAVVKYSFNGEKQWQTVVGGRNIESTRKGLDILANGNYILAGHASSKIGDFEGQQAFGDLFDLFAAEIDREGNIKWVKNYGGNKNDYCYAVEATSDGGFIMGGNTKSTTDTFENIGTFYDNAYVLKLDANGNKEWADVIKSSDTSEVTTILEQNGKYVALGDTRGRDFDFKDKNKGSMDAFLAEYDAAGKRLSLETIGGSKEDYSTDILPLNDHQNAVLLYSASTDGDMKDMNRGEYDGDVLIYNYAEAPVNPENPEKPDKPESENIEKPDTPEANGGTVDPDHQNGNNGNSDKKPSGKNPATGDQNSLPLWALLLIAAAVSAPVVKRKMNSKADE